MSNLNFNEKLELFNLADRIIDRQKDLRHEIVFETYKKLLPLFEVEAAKDEINPKGA